MNGNDANKGDIGFPSEEPGLESPNQRSVALSGYMKGPDPEKPDYVFKLSHDIDFEKFVELEWRDIRWIDWYPPQNVDGSTPPDLGYRTIWVDRDSAVLQAYIGGEIMEDYMPKGDTTSGWLGPEAIAMRMGPSSTNPPCICRL